MTSRATLALALTAMIGATGFVAVNALAQQPGPPPRASEQAPQRQVLTPEDRAALIDARIAGVKAGLRLTADQEKLWPPVEQTVREGLAKGAELRARLQGQPRPGDMLERMRLRAEAMSARGEAMRKIVDAGQPLYASLSEDQKRRLGFLMNHGRRAGMGVPPGSPMGAMRERMQGMWNRGEPARGDRPGMMGPRSGDREGSSRFERSPPGDRDPRGMTGPRGDDRSGRFNRDDRDPRGGMGPRGFDRRDRDDRARGGPDGAGPRGDERFDRGERDRRGMAGPRDDNRFGGRGREDGRSPDRMRLRNEPDDRDGRSRRDRDDYRR